MRYLTLLVLAAVFMGCAARVSLYRDPFPAKAEDANIDVYRTTKPDKSYIEIGQLEFGSSSDSINISKLKTAARKIGADAIIITGSASQNSSAVPVGKLVMIKSEDVGLKAVAIKYK